MGIVEKRELYKTGFLTAWPGSRTVAHLPVNGMQRLLLDQKRECLLYVPRDYHHDAPSAMAVMLHGAGGNAEHGMSYLYQYADEKNILLLAPSSQDYTWDIIAGNSFGTDVIFIDQALSYVFARFSINKERLAIGGFSDGASYGLSLGLSNGELFSHIIAFSPGFFYTPEARGYPGVYVSHGVNDDVLPIDPCSRRLLPQLKRRGLAIQYDEFEGRHEIPAIISKAAINWFLP